MKTTKQSMKNWLTKWQYKNAIRHYQRLIIKIETNL